MPGEEDLRKQFEELIAGAGLEDLRAVSRGLVAGSDVYHGQQPNLRRPRLAEVFIYRIRVDLDGSEPPIWRTLEVRSDLTLDVVHSLLQGAFAWNDSHLHRFSLGGGPFDRGSQFFLCPFDVEEGEDEGVPTELVRLDEALQDLGDALRYVYDYGDSWELTLRLEEVRRPTEQDPLVVCVDGQRAAPPEDCGGLTNGEDLAKVLDDPALFDIEELNRWLIDPFMLLRKADVGQAAINILRRLMGLPQAERAIAEALRLTEPGPALTEEELLVALRPIQWYLDRAHGDGIPLTTKGNVKVADAKQVAAILPMSADYPGNIASEAQVWPLLTFREALQELGLLRKSKGRLVLTRAGEAARTDVGTLWGHLASRLVPDKPGFGQDAALVTLLFIAASAQQPYPEDMIGDVMAALGWRHDDDQMPVDFYDVRWGTPVLDILYSLDEPKSFLRDHPISRVAAALAREALLAEE